MSAAREKGFTLVEVLIAMMVLSVGIMALVGSSAMATRMIGRGRESTQVGQVATARSEWLRQIAAATTPPCGSALLKDSTWANPNTGITEQWQVLALTGSGTRDVRMMYSYKVPKGTRTDTMTLTLLCK
jgi:prepilin-type N-terminal cleavage/methylation domain-containing protein